MPSNHPHSAGFAYAAAIWSFAFALLSLAWALGSDVGANTLARSIEDQARERSGSFVTLMWVTVFLKVLAGAIALSLVPRWGARIPRWLRLTAAWTAAVILTLYGVAGIVEKVLWKTGVRTVPASFGADRVDWYLFFWDPFWLLGGILFAFAAWTFQRARST
ncbi:MAG TPA: DUF3995 domain-containing protein [Thermomicrobiales bacterium]|nr:DUF3995 domain-containing protein [Thermomicrobiales bacterium]